MRRSSLGGYPDRLPAFERVRPPARGTAARAGAADLLASGPGMRSDRQGQPAARHSVRSRPSRRPSPGGACASPGIDPERGARARGDAGDRGRADRDVRLASRRAIPPPRRRSRLRACSTGTPPTASSCRLPDCGRVGLEYREGMEVTRTLDLRAGVLHQRVQEGESELGAVTFCSLARPGTLVLRATSDDGMRLREPSCSSRRPLAAWAVEGAPPSRVNPPAEPGYVVEQARDGSVVAVSEEATPGGAAVAARQRYAGRRARSRRRLRRRRARLPDPARPCAARRRGGRGVRAAARGAARRLGGSAGRAATSCSTAIPSCSSRYGWACSI